MAELCEAANAKVGYDSVRIANYLCNGNYAISGGTDGCQAVQDLAKPKGARMTVKLAVAGAFHTSYMQPAQEELEYAPVICWPYPRVHLLCLITHPCHSAHRFIGEKAGMQFVALPGLFKSL